MIYRFTNVVLTSILLLVLTIESIACSCEGKGTVTNSVTYADVVFSGQLITRSLTKNYDSLGIIITGDTSKIHYDWRKYPIAVIRIKVDKIFKGQLLSDTIIILTPPNGAACGYSFQVGQKYIVYATIFDELLITDQYKRRTNSNKTFWTHQCTRTQDWNKTEEHEILMAINKSQPPH